MFKGVLKVSFLFVFGAALVFGASLKNADAVPTLIMTDGSTTVTVTDGQVGFDLNPVVGRITYIGGFGAYSIQTNTGTTKPVIGSPTSPRLDLSFDVVSSGATSSLFISFYDKDFTSPAPGSLNLGMGGTTDGTVTGRSFHGATNAIPATTLVSTIGPLPGNSFSGDVSGSIGSASPYSLGVQVEILHGGGDGLQTTGNINASVPEPTTMLLLGIGMVGLIGAGTTRRLKRAKKE